MGEFLGKIQRLVELNQIRISEHGFDELSNDRISVRDVVQGLREATVVEEYPVSGRGPAILVLEYDPVGRPIHVVWGVPIGRETPADLVTAYRPDPEMWDSALLRRRR